MSCYPRQGHVPSSDVILHLQPGPAAPNAAVKQAKGSHGRQVMKVRTPGGRGGAEAQKASPGQVKQASSASDQMAAAMKLLSETVSQAMMGGVSRPMTTGQAQGVRIKILTKSIYQCDLYHVYYSRVREVPKHWQEVQLSVLPRVVAVAVERSTRLHRRASARYSFRFSRPSSEPVLKGKV